MKSLKTPLEDQEMAVLADYLNACGFLWCHVPNEGKRSPRLGARMRRLGLKAGVPDVLVFGHRYSGVAIELKRVGGRQPTSEQQWWLAELEKCGWVCIVAYGAMDAIEKMHAASRGCGATKPIGMHSSVSYKQVYRGRPQRDREVTRNESICTTQSQRKLQAHHRFGGPNRR